MVLETDWPLMCDEARLFPIGARPHFHCTRHHPNELTLTHRHTRILFADGRCGILHGPALGLSGTKLPEHTNEITPRPPAVAAHKVRPRLSGTARAHSPQPQPLSHKLSTLSRPMRNFTWVSVSRFLFHIVVHSSCLRTLSDGSPLSSHGSLRPAHDSRFVAHSSQLAVAPARSRRPRRSFSSCSSPGRDAPRAFGIVSLPCLKPPP